MTLKELDKAYKAETVLTEKQKNCQYCHGGRHAKPIVDEGSDFLAFDLRGMVAFGDDGTVTIHGPIINYCPMCGRPLNRKEEQ